MIRLDESIRSLRGEKIKRIYIYEGDEQVAVIEKSSIFTIQSDKDLFLSLTKDQMPYRSNALPAAFQINMPEGFLKDFLTAKLSKYFKVDPMLFLAIQGSNPIGKYTFKSDYNLSIPNTEFESLEALSSSQDEQYFGELMERFYLDNGISGAQPKTLLTSEKGSLVTNDLIVKSFDEIDYKELALNEYLCMSMAKEAGLEVPEFYLSEDRKRFIVERFDVSEGRRLNMEDMMALSGHKDKYHGSYEEIARIIDLYSCQAEQDKLTLFKSLVLNRLVENGDAHLKNFAFIYSDSDGVRLSPTFDVVSTSVYADLDKAQALKMNGKVHFPDKKELLTFAETIGVGQKEACSIIQNVTSKVKTFIKNNDLSGVEGLQDIIEKNIVTLEKEDIQVMGYSVSCKDIQDRLSKESSQSNEKSMAGPLI